MWKNYCLILLVGSCVLITPQLAYAAADFDGDGLGDDEETKIYYTDPNVADTDGDGFIDGDEIKNGYSPVHAGKKNSEVDSDADGLDDAIELALGTNISQGDTDGDGTSDSKEVFLGYNPLKGEADRSLPKHVEINLSTQQMSYYLNGVQIETMPVSTGLIKWATPTGEFKIMRKVPVVRYKGEDYDYPNTKWNLEFKKTYYIHTAYWHNQFGKRPMSHGCVNMTEKDAQKMYTFLDVGDKVKITGRTPYRVVTPKKT